MSNPFKYFKDKKELWADWERPKSTDSNEVWRAFADRPHFTVSPELDALLAHEQVIDRTEFDVRYKRYMNEQGRWTDAIAIPLPKEREREFRNNISKETPMNKEQQDIPMDKDGWVKVKDKLPEPSKTKKWQIYSPSTLGVTDGFYWGQNTDPCNGWSMVGVTHYKELPQSPKEEKES